MNVCELSIKQLLAAQQAWNWTVTLLELAAAAGGAMAYRAWRRRRRKVVSAPAGLARLTSDFPGIAAAVAGAGGAAGSAGALEALPADFQVPAHDGRLLVISLRATWAACRRDKRW